MFHCTYNITNDGEFVLGYNDFDEAMKAYDDILKDYIEDGTMLDHEWQMLHVIRGEL